MTAANYNNNSAPLTDEHCECLNQVLASISQTRELVQRCKNCGLDVSRAEEEINSQEDLAKKLKAEFFPNRP